MAYFDSEDEVYKYIGGVFEAGAEHETVGPKFAAADVILQVYYTDPDSQMTIRMEQPKMTVHCGEEDEEADVKLYMPADTGDKYWRGEYNLAVGLAKGHVKAKGPVNKILKLVPLTKGLFPLYKESITEKDGAAA
ncbi:MAG: hypothetical protein QOF76_3065 [Solirubrobacteraceae bacterium]|nr:hypothetical protein [Solirubrobacteraceae bacterium]